MTPGMTLLKSLNWRCSRFRGDALKKLKKASSVRRLELVKTETIDRVYPVGSIILPIEITYHTSRRRANPHFRDLGSNWLLNSKFILATSTLPPLVKPHHRGSNPLVTLERCRFSLSGPKHIGFSLPTVYNRRWSPRFERKIAYSSTRVRPFPPYP